MRKSISLFLITSLLSSCVAHEVGYSSNTAAVTATTDQAEIDADPDAYSWLVNGTEEISAAIDTACGDFDATCAVQPSDVPFAVRTLEPFAPVEPTEPDTSTCSTMTSGKVVTIRKLLFRFLKNKWSKLLKTGDEAAAAAASKLLTSPGLQNEAKDALIAALKNNPTSATGALKSFLGWVKKQPKTKIALGVLAIVIAAGALPFIIDELKEALQTHLLGIETSSKKIERLEKEVNELKALLKKKCEESDQQPATPDDDIVAQLEKKLDELEAAIAEFDKLEQDLSTELDAIEKALEGIGLDKIEPDPS